MEGCPGVHDHPDISCLVECIKDKFYFGTLANGKREPRCRPEIVLFSIDNELVYNHFFNDFGPLNLACLYRYCCKVNKKLRNPANKHKKIVHYTSPNENKRANAAFLAMSYAIIYLKWKPRDAFANLVAAIKQPLKPFQDASMNFSIYTISLEDCLNALHKALTFGFINFDDFDHAEYEKYEQMRYGDMNWLLPDKFIGFTGPSTETGSAYHPPERYIDYFLRNDVIAVVRLNRRSYDAARFTRAGIDHHDMFLPDGSVPSCDILSRFLRLAETTIGPIAVHCKAGLGRTGSLVAAYIVKHYGMSATEAIAWLRICRPGSVIGHQQAWLQNIESQLWRAGQNYRLKHHGDSDAIVRHKRGIYSIARKLLLRRHEIEWKKLQKESERSNVEKFGDMRKMKIGKPCITNILGKFRTPRITEPPPSPATNERRSTHEKSQGDRLNEIKTGRSLRL